MLVLGEAVMGALYLIRSRGCILGSVGYFREGGRGRRGGSEINF